MPITIIGDEALNHISLPQKFREECSGTIVLHWAGATLSVEDHNMVGHVYWTMAGGSTISIGQGVVFGHLTLHVLADGARIEIGRNVGLQGSVEIGTHERASITIGDECLIAGGVSIVASDIHHVYDLKSNKRLNPARDIHIERHVWVATNCTILKGAHIGEMSVVAACSVVTGKSPPNTVIAGVPAKVVRKKVYWRR